MAFISFVFENPQCVGNLSLLFCVLYVSGPSFFFVYLLASEVESHIISASEINNPADILDKIHFQFMSCYQYRAKVVMMDSSLCNPASGSPNSSEDVESRHGTPETKLSVFTPEEFRVHQKSSLYAAARLNFPPPFALGSPHGKQNSPLKMGKTISFGSQDPFVVDPNAVSTVQTIELPPKLSPTASSFTPLKLEGGSPGRRILHDLPTQPHKTGSQSGTPNLSAYTAPSFFPDSANLEKHHRPIAELAPTQAAPAPSSSQLSIEVVPPKFGLFSSDGGTSRSVMISQVSRNTSTKEIQDFFSVSTRRVR